MAGNAPQHKEADTEQSPPAVHHRQNGTPTKSSHSRQDGESKHSSPVNDNKKRKRDASEASDDAVVISRPSSQQPTSSSTYQAAQLSPPTAPQVSSSSVGKSPSTASGHPCDGEVQASHAVSHDQQCTMPAEKDTGIVDDSVVWRSKEKLAACLSCHQIQKGGGEAASRRVAEALIFATSMTMLKATGQVSSFALQAAQRDN